MFFKSKRLGVFLIMSAMLLAVLFLAACESDEEKVGRLVAYRASFTAQDMMSGQVDDLYSPGIFIVRLEDGTRVDVIISQELLETLSGQDMVVIEPIEPIEFEYPPGSSTIVEWEVTGLAE